MDGPGLLFTTLTAIVDADLTPAIRGRQVSIAYLQQPRPFTLLMAHDNGFVAWRTRGRTRVVDPRAAVVAAMEQLLHR